MLYGITLYQTMFGVPDSRCARAAPHNEYTMYDYFCLPHSWYPSQFMFLCAQNTQMMIPLFKLMQSIGPCRWLIDLTGFI